ncbi:MAG: type III-B CRISPR module RAMP protein Cmr1 [Deltaproteobacteria bacterium]|nr:type III-B CRISPR module RAMP protein Cmr1 [Deltaproteobacteria bacterium]
MAFNISRYYKQERMEFDVEVVTPMFLGGADQNAELRSPPFKAMLRQCWRIVNGGKYKTVSSLLEEESKLFGSATEKDSGKSRVKIIVEGDVKPQGENSEVQYRGTVFHPEVQQGRKVSALLYLGYGPIEWAGGKVKYKFNHFVPGDNFKLTIIFSEENKNELLKVLSLFRHIGTIGSRSRNGWGSFNLISKGAEFINLENLYENRVSGDPYQVDYAHTLGRDVQGPLIWHTKDNKRSWEEIMHQLAELYLGLRLKFPLRTNNSIEERHLLGYPITNHPISNNRKNERYASPLRMRVIKSDRGFFKGQIIHFPHGIPNRNVKIPQDSFWKNVYKILDKDTPLTRVASNGGV